ncbi:hypothetical protein [Rufibacter sp. XAAS-G3-1]|uniref:hypothetical protein n=1 Tax=Rufibacter sp. XAAS-G3-1 TaxID=2729134 RepID=UPI0015E75BF5|nr:hypothetical protein [Rufibacter sp. XAAS-G3-1]
MRLVPYGSGPLGGGLPRAGQPWFRPGVEGLAAQPLHPQDPASGQRHVILMGGDLDESPLKVGLVGSQFLLAHAKGGAHLHRLDRETMGHFRQRHLGIDYTQN